MKQFFCANDSKFADTLRLAAEGANIGKPDLVSEQKLRAVIQAFMLMPVKEKEKQLKKIQAVSVSTDFEQLLTNAFNVFVAEDNFDMGWEAAFREVPRDDDKDFWEIGDVENGITFRKMDEGGRVEVDTVTGTQQLIYVDYYGGALGFTDKAIRFRKLAMLFDAARGFRNKFYANKADNHYLLIATAAAVNVLAYQGTGADTRVQRDVLSINRGAYDIGNRCKDKGYGDMANAPLLLYANPFDRERIEAAFRVTTAALTAGQQNGAEITTQPIRRVYTYNSNVVAGSPIMCLPGNKAQRNEAMAPTTYVAPTDILTLNRVQSVWSIYGAGIADEDQFEQITLG